MNGWSSRYPPTTSLKIKTYGVINISWASLRIPAWIGITRPVFFVFFLKTTTSKQKKNNNNNNTRGVIEREGGTKKTRKKKGKTRREGSKTFFSCWEREGRGKNPASSPPFCFYLFVNVIWKKKKKTCKQRQPKIQDIYRGKILGI